MTALCVFVVAFHPALSAAKTTYFFDLVLKPAQDTVHLRRAIMRPERPAQTFTLRDYVDWSDRDRFDRGLFLAGLAMKAEGVTGGLDPDAPVWDGLLDDIEDIEDELLDEAHTARLVDPNSGIASGGWTERRWQARRHTATMVLKRVVDGVESEVPATGVAVGDYWRAEEKPYFEKFYPDDFPSKELQTSLGGFTYQQSAHSMGNQFMFPEVKPKETTPSIGFTGWWSETGAQNGPAKADQFLKDVGMGLGDLVNLSNTLAPQGEDMNNLLFNLPENPCHGSIDAPAGTMWLPSKPGYQRMMTGVRFHYDLGFAGQVAGVGVPAEILKMRTLCLDMKLKMPEPGVMYFPFRPSDQALYGVGEMMDQSSFRGPWDQARLWLYQSKASLPEINDTLEMRLPPSAYLAALGDLAHLGLVGPEDTKLAKVFDPQLLVASGAPLDTGQWYAKVLEGAQAKALARYLASSPSEYLKLGSDAADKGAIQMFVVQMGTFLASRKAEVRLAALKLLIENEDRLAPVKGKLSGFSVSLSRGDAGEVALAKKAVSAGFQIQLTASPIGDEGV